MFPFFKHKKNPLQSGFLSQKNFMQSFNFYFRGGLLLIDVEIEKESFTFMLDTGAYSVIPTFLLRRLSLSSYDENIATVDADGKYKDSKLYRLPSLKIGSIEFKNFSVIADDFSQHFPLSCLKFDGILGYNFLQNLILKIDYEKQLCTLSDKTLETKSYKKSRLRVAKSGIIEFKLRVESRDLWIGLDSGKNDGLMIGDKKFKDLFQKKQYKSQRTTGTFSSSFNGLNEHSFIDTYLIKNFSIDSKIFIKAFPCSYQESALNIAGNEFLKNFTIIIDFKKKYIYFQEIKGSTLDERLPNPFGFTSFWSEEKKLYISAITQDTPAYNSKLKIGDKIMSINALDTLEFSKEEYCKHSLLCAKTMLYKQSDKELEIIIKREGKLIREQLSLSL